MGRITICIFLFFSIAFVACNDAEIGKAEDVDVNAIYFDYRISGEEGNPEVTTLLQYKMGGENGTTLTIDKPGKVELDGELLKLDSSRVTGAYYEMQKPVEAFAGTHQISFTSPGGKQYKESFSFQPFSLAADFEDSISSGDYTIPLTGVNEGERMRVALADTVFGSNGIEKTVTIKDGKIRIPGDEMMELANGPISLEIEREINQPLKNGTPEGGRLVISYILHREILLSKSEK